MITVGLLGQVRLLPATNLGLQPLPSSCCIHRRRRTMRPLRILFALTVGIAVSLIQQVKAAEPIMVVPQHHHHQQHRLTLDSMSQSVRGMEYAVRGAVVILADQLSRELAKGKNDLLVDDDDKYPLFDHIVYTNIGNPHSVGQPALTWPRQVLALVDLPAAVGVDHPDVRRLFPADAVARARDIQAGLSPGGTGAYSHSQGVPALRREVAHFIDARDDIPTTRRCNPDHIFLTNGASAAIQMVLQTLVASNNTGVMLPIPQYPIYSATVDLLGGQKVGYYLDEEAGWELNMAELERAFQQAIDRGIDVNSLVVINPGNPTGTVLSKQNLQDIVQFCARHNLVLLADEVYQENVYEGEFYSCRRAAYDTGLLDRMELVSFHSVSKGVFGECGRRGGYMELTGFDPAVLDQLYKVASSTLCATLSGQIMTSLMVRGPAPGDESYDSHEAEKRIIYESLKRRSEIVSKGLNDIPGFRCQKASGSMYCFPSVELPINAVRHATSNGESPDSFYCKSLLQRTGICVVPASGFGQRPGRFGFRTTFLPCEAEMERCVALIRQHHEEFCESFS